MSSISIHCSHLWRGVSSPGSISMAEAAVRGQRPGVTRLRIIASPHSLLLKRLLEPCDLIMMWFLLFFFPFPPIIAGNRHVWQTRLISSICWESTFFFRITCRFISTGESSLRLSQIMLHSRSGCQELRTTLQSLPVHLQYSPRGCYHRCHRGDRVALAACRQAS